MTLLRRVIGRALRRARRNQGKTLRDVADTARVSIQYLSEVERGRKEVSSEVLAAICAAHGWTLLDLVDEVRSELRAEALVEIADVRPATAPVRSIVSSAAPQVRLAA